MKTTKKTRSTGISPEEAMKQLQKIFKERGSKALEMARKEMLQEEIECKEIREAITYFMTDYWHDFARPALLSLVCKAVGGDPEITTPIAVSMILTSGAADIHDDIIDQSKIKGSRPTVFGKFGKDTALLTGDALLFKGLILLYQAMKKGIPAEKLLVITDIMEKTFFELGDAEALELRLRRRLDVTPEEYLNVIKKRAAIVEGFTRIGAILGGGSKEEIENLGKYGRILGILITLRDDLIDMIDYEEAQHRIERECLPLPILYALQDPKFKPIITPYLVKKAITQKDTVRVVENIRKAGGIRRTQRLMNTLIKEASLSIRDIKIDRQYLELLLYAMAPHF